MITTLLRPLTAPAFDVADLLIARGWADFHDLAMTVRLDSGHGPVRPEETLAFTPAGADAPLWLMWRERDTVVVQPAAGHPMRFGRLADALGDLIPEAPPALTDLHPTESWL
jgi:hypothetical protein